MEGVEGYFHIVGECGPEGVGTEIQIEFDLSQDMNGEAVTITVCHDLGAAYSVG